MRLLLLRLFMFGCIFSLFGCGKELPPSDPTSSEVEGSYIGIYADGLEIFELKPDASFTQEFKVRGRVVYSNSGTWKMAGSDITLKPCMMCDGIYGPGGDTLYEAMTAKWRNEPVRLELGHYPYFVQKVSGVGATGNASKITEAEKKEWSGEFILRGRLKR